MRLAAILLPFTVGLSLAQSPQTPTTSKDWLNRGVQAFKQGHYPEAVTDFQTAADLSPDDVTARLYLATAYMQQFIPGADAPANVAIAQKADAEFRVVLSNDSNNRVALASLASLALNQKKFDEAGDWYQRLIRVDPKNAEAYYSLGFIAWSKWYPAYAKARTESGMKLTDPGPISDLAVRNRLRSQFWTVLDDGMWNLNRAIDLNSQYDDAMAYMNLLTRERADLRDTREEYTRDIAEADQWMRKTLEARKIRLQQMGPAGDMLMARTAAPPAPPPPPPPPPNAQEMAAQRVSGILIDSAIQAQKLISQTPPVYPPLARQAHVQGSIKLQISIDAEGSVQNIQVVSGHPLLVPAAVEAVKKWRYQPTLLNGSPVAVSTTVDVIFGVE